MRISHRNQFLFIHVPKAAGCSVNRALRRHADFPERWWMNRWLARVGVRVNYLAPYYRRRFRGHVDALTVRRWLPRKVFDGLFKFAFVRNPWDRMVSQYHYIRSNELHHHHRLVMGMAFPEFAAEWTRRGKCKQLPMIADRQGTVLMDFVGRFESLQDDFHEIGRTLGIKSDLHHANRSKHRDFRSYYDRKTRQIVADGLAEDIDRFEYVFDDDLAAAA